MRFILKYVLTAFVMLSFTGIQGQVISIPDSAFLGRLVELGVDANADGEITVQEAEQVTALDLSWSFTNFSSIEDLSGLEHFINLDSLAVVNQSISIAELSANNQLTYLDLSSNDNLQALNLGALTQLEHLRLEETPALDSLDLSALVQLQSLAVNNKVFLDISNCAALVSVSAWWVENLDVTGCPVLENLECSNQSSLDLTGNPELATLNCIAFSGGESLTSLDLTSNPKLRILTCSQNLISDLDLSQNTLLEEFYGSHNPLGDIDLSQNTRLRRFRCSNCGLDALDVSKNEDLAFLNCNSNEITSLVFENHLQFEELYLQNNPTTHLDLYGCRNLKTLDLATNLRLTQLDLSWNRKLEYIQISGNLRLVDVCVWEMPFPGPQVLLNDSGSPYLKYKYCTLDAAATASSEVNMYPNPVRDVLFFEGENLMNASISIKTMEGKEVYHAQTGVTRSSVDVSRLPAGLYQLAIESNSGNEFFMFVKQ